MVTRRASLPGADELFRSTAEPPAPVETQPVQAQPQAASVDNKPSLQVAPEVHQSPADKRPRHEEKVTFYCTGADLTRLERAKLILRADHGVSSDRGRIVRASLSEILDDFEARGEDSSLVRRLKSEREAGES